MKKRNRPLEFKSQPTAAKQPRYFFYDSYSTRCSIEEAGSFNKSIYIGAHDHRMMLSQKQAKQLLPYLEEFAKTGHLPKEIVKE